MLLSVWYYQPRFKKVPIVNVDMNLIPTPEQLLKATVAIRPHQIKKNRLVSWDGLIALKPSSKVVHLLACLEICLHHEIGTPLDIGSKSMDRTLVAIEHTHGFVTKG